MLIKTVHSSFAKGEVCKLHIGAGYCALPGWFNTDSMPSPVPLYFLDVRKRFPFQDGELHYIYCEHVIEHLRFEDGMRMLGESFRTLGCGGKIRVATPDLSRILSVYCERGEHEAYKNWAIEFSGLPTFARAECFVVNNFMRSWGHKFIYDEPTLSDSLLRAGFVNVRRFQIGESSDPNFVGIEQHAQRIGEFANAFETMILQADKP